MNTETTSKTLSRLALATLACAVFTVPAAASAHVECGSVQDFSIPCDPPVAGVSLVTFVPDGMVAWSGSVHNDEFNDEWSAASILDGDLETSYSSDYFESEVNTSNDYIAAFTSEPFAVSTIAFEARRAEGVVNAMPESFALWVLTADGSWRYLDEYLSMGESVVVDVRDEDGNPTMNRGFYLLPTRLGADIFGDHYLQLAEVTFAVEGVAI